MISWGSCSSSRYLLAALLAAGAALGCRHAGKAGTVPAPPSAAAVAAAPAPSGAGPGAATPAAPVAPAPPGASAALTVPEPAAPEPAEKDPMRVVLLPLENLSAAPAPLKEIAVGLELEVARRVDVIGGDILEQFLAKHRLRYTGGIGADVAHAAREELGADAILVSSLYSLRQTPYPLFGISVRLVSASEEPQILWMESGSFVGDESPGLLRLKVLDTMKAVQGRVLAKLGRSLDRFLASKPPEDVACGGPGSWGGPRVRYRAPLLQDPYEYTLAVVPFLNKAGRRGAGEALALEFVRQLVATGKYKVLEPGVVRDLMLRTRILIPGGLSLEATRLMLGALGVEVVVSGTVFDFDETAGPAGARIQFSTTMLDGGSGEVVWQSRSYSKGDDGVFAFGLGRIPTVGRLGCRMVGGVVSQLADKAKFRPGLVRPPRAQRAVFGVFEKSDPEPPAAERPAAVPAN